MLIKLSLIGLCLILFVYNTIYGDGSADWLVYWRSRVRIQLSDPGFFFFLLSSYFPLMDSVVSCERTLSGGQLKIFPGANKLHGSFNKTYSFTGPIFLYIPISLLVYSASFQ